MDITISIGQKRYDSFKESLQAVVSRQIPTDIPIVVDDAYIDKWIKDIVKAKMNDIIAVVASWQTAPGEALDVSDLTFAERLQVQTLITTLKND